MLVCKMKKATNELIGVKMTMNEKMVPKLEPEDESRSKICWGGKEREKNISAHETDQKKGAIYLHDH